MIAKLYDVFKHWSSNGSVWIISDPHLGDPHSREWNPEWPMPEEYLNTVNMVANKNDTLICLGDCGIDLTYIKRMKAGYKVLIKGNHDSKGNATYKGENLFDEVYSGPLFIADQILLSHEPVYGLNFCVNIHGHCHTGAYEYVDEWGGKHINLASDVVHWKPTNLGKLIKEGVVAHIPTIHRLAIDRQVGEKIVVDLESERLSFDDDHDMETQK